MTTSPALSKRKGFDVAIVGGGITGLAFAVGLCRQGVPVQIYEAAPQFEEIGAGVSLGPNAVRALQRLAPEMYDAFLRHATGNGSVDRQGIFFDMRHGIGEPSLITSVTTPGGRPHNVHRAHLLDDIKALLPEAIAHFGKRLESIDEKPGQRLTLRFADGSTAQADAVVGCDGIKSRVRHLILSPDSPSKEAQFSGKFAYRGLIPMDRAVAILGENLARNSQGYLGPHGHILTFPIGHGSHMNVVAFASSKDGRWENDKWVVPGSRESVQSDFKDWGTPVQNIMKELGEVDKWGLFDHPPAETFYCGRIAMMGDAAHASTPHQGAGAGQGIEDAYVMASLLGHSDTLTPDDVDRAFRAFDTVRRPRTQRVVSTSRAAGQLYDFELPGVEHDVEKIALELGSRYDWIWNVDLDEHLTQAVEFMDQASI